MNNKVSIITVNYNGIKDTCELIDSLTSCETYPFEIVVVDNGSSNPNEHLLIQEQYPLAKVIRSDENLGFAGGNNLGIMHATGRYLFFLNNDTIITEPILERLIKPLQEHPSIGCVSPKIVCWPQKEIIQFAGFTPMSKITLRNKSIGFQEFDKGQFDTSYPTAFAHGAAMMIRTTDIHLFGVMPDFYFLYYEELDWCDRMHRAGFEIRYEGTVTIHHKDSSSVGMDSPLKIYYHTRNRFLFAQRVIQSQAERLLAYAYQALLAYPKQLIGFLVQRKTHLIAPLTKGTINGIIALNKGNRHGIKY